MSELLAELLAATLALAGELAAAAPWAVPLLPAVWAGLVWVSVRKGRELGGFLTLLAGLFLFFAVWAATSGNAGMDRWQRRELSIDYLYIALFVALFLFLPSLLINLAVHFSLRAKRGRGLGHSEMRPGPGRPAVRSTKPPEDEEVFAVPVEEQRAALAQATERRAEGEEPEESLAGRPAALLVADLTRSCLAVAPEIAAGCVEAFNEILAEAAAAHRGRLLQSVDTALVYQFASAREAAACGMEVLDRLRERNAAHPGAPAMARIGVHTGLVVQDQGQVRGRDAAIAAALMVTAPPGGLQVSALTHALIADPLKPLFEYLGEKRLKGLPEPLDIWRLASGTTGPEA